MQFRSWIENSLNTFVPEAMPQADRGSETPASDEVKRTGLQPQVDSEEIETKEKENQDKISAIDSGIEHFDTKLYGMENSHKIKIFKKFWDELKEKWEEIKMREESDETEDGLGAETGQDDSEYYDVMKRNPNAVPAPPQAYSGPGTFGN